MLEVMSCPVLVAQDQIDRCEELIVAAEEARDFAAIAQKMHLAQPFPVLSPVLVEVARMLDRHARELSGLIERLLPLADHDAPHEHIEPDDATVKELLIAMFGDPRQDGPVT